VIGVAGFSSASVANTGGFLSVGYRGRALVAALGFKMRLTIFKGSIGDGEGEI
jgi:hypothetical protein